MTPTPTPQQIIELALNAGFSYDPRTNHLVAVDGYTEVTVTPGLKRFATLLLERFGQAQAVQQEPVYQYQKSDGSWVDQSKLSYDYNIKYGASTVRILYTNPAPAEVREPLTDEAKAVIDAARTAMDDSVEAYDSEGSIKISSHIAASLSLRLDEYDRAIKAAPGITGGNA